MVVRVKQSPSQASMAHRAALISVSYSPEPDTSQSHKTMDTGLRASRAVPVYSPAFTGTH